MGARTTDTLREIERLRRNLDAKITELEKRMPPSVAWSKRAVGLLTGGAGSGLVVFALRRARARGKRQAAPATQPVSVKLISAPAALGIAGIWAAVKVFEARAKAERPAAPAAAPVRPIRTERGA